MSYYNIWGIIVNELSFKCVSGTTVEVDSKSGIIIAPSVLSANFTRVGEAVSLIESAGGDWVHLDVMDGMFVPNITFGSKMVRDIREITSLPLDVHLMIEKPEYHIEKFSEAGADLITFHLEAAVHVHRILSQIKKRGKSAGISIVPSTPVELLSEILPELDLILVMSVNPGYGGQNFIENSIDKIQRLDHERKKQGYSFKISVDGGISRKTARLVRDAGADVLVTGSSFFSSTDPGAEAAALRGSS